MTRQKLKLLQEEEYYCIRKKTAFGLIEFAGNTMPCKWAVSV